MLKRLTLFVLFAGCSDDRHPMCDKAFTGGVAAAQNFAEQPSFGPTVSQTVAPPPVSGGTLLVLADGNTAVAADSARDEIYVADLARSTLTSTIKLQAHDEPGRGIEDGNGRVHVVLRSGGAVVTIDPKQGTILSRDAVCAAPRGIAYDRAANAVHVACAGGELTTLPAAGGAATRTVMVERDLRDVVVKRDGTLAVSKFRDATLLTLDAQGKVATRQQPDPTTLQTFNNPPDDIPTTGGCGDAPAPVAHPDVQGTSQAITFTPSVAWRTVVSPAGDVVMVHQRGATEPVQVTTGGYGGLTPCSGIVHATVSGFGGASFTGPALAGVVLPVDIAFSPDGNSIAIVSAGNAHNALPQVAIVNSTDLQAGPSCMNVLDPRGNTAGEVVAAAYSSQGDLVLQSREPAMLQVFSNMGGLREIALSTISTADTGQEIFHANSGAGLACASCHAEGGDDGRIWKFAGTGDRRTQSLRGGVLGTEPFHWDGNEHDLTALVSDVFVGRMSGPELTVDQSGALSRWMNAIPLIPHAAAADPAAVDRGKTIFASAEAGCSTCHTGALLTNNATANVGTGGSFQVPSLRGLAFRAPYMHAGCAATLRDRFGDCGGSSHGGTLTPAQIDDLIAYLETL